MCALRVYWSVGRSYMLLLAKIMVKLKTFGLSAINHHHSNKAHLVIHVWALRLISTTLLCNQFCKSTVHTKPCTIQHLLVINGLLIYVFAILYFLIVILRYIPQQSRQENYCKMGKWDIYLNCLKRPLTNDCYMPSRLSKRPLWYLYNKKI